VNPITLNIGSNDVLQFLASKCGFPATDTCAEAQVLAEYEHITSNVSGILTQVRAAAPKAQIVLIGAYNFYPTVVPGGDKLTAFFASLPAKAAAEVPNTSFANNLPVFNPSGTFGGPESGDIRPYARSPPCVQVERSTPPAQKLTFTRQSSATPSSPESSRPAGSRTEVVV